MSSTGELSASAVNTSALPSVPALSPIELLSAMSLMNCASVPTFKSKFDVVTMDSPLALLIESPSFSALSCQAESVLSIFTVNTLGLLSASRTRNCNLYGISALFSLRSIPPSKLDVFTAYVSRQCAFPPPIVHSTPFAIRSIAS